MSTTVISMISLGSIGIVFGIILSILDKKLKVDQDPLVKKIQDVLPGINCGACGFPSCEGLAKWLAENRTLSKKCIPGGDKVNNEIAEILGITSSKKESAINKKVIVLCGAKEGEKKSHSVYIGPKTCESANITRADIDCQYGCLGFGDCVKVCPVNALKIVSRLVVVDYQKCIGCGKCVAVCPRKILKLVDVKNNYLIVVSCNNPESGAETKKVCSKGCIGCSLCIKLIKDSPFFMEEGVSRINTDKLGSRDCQEIMPAVEKCPVRIISKFDV